MLHYFFINIDLHSAHMVVHFLSHCNLNTSLKGICLILLLPGDDLAPHVNFPQAGHWCRGHHQAPVVPHQGHHRCSRPPSDLLDVPPWKHLSTRRCPCSSMHQTQRACLYGLAGVSPVHAHHSGIIGTT